MKIYFIEVKNCLKKQYLNYNILSFHGWLDYSMKSLSRTKTSLNKIPIISTSIRIWSLQILIYLMPPSVEYNAAHSNEFLIPKSFHNLPPKWRKISTFKYSNNSFLVLIISTTRIQYNRKFWFSKNLRTFDLKKNLVKYLGKNFWKNNFSKKCL